MSITKVQRTYSSRNRRSIPSVLVSPSSPPSTFLLSSPPATPETTRPSKRTYSEMSTEENVVPIFSLLKRHKVLPMKRLASFKSNSRVVSFKSEATQQKTLTQLHFNIDQSILRTCPICDLSYTKGASDDETLHRAHCSRVQKVMDWGREEEKHRVQSARDLVSEIETDVKLKGSKKTGRIICLPANIGGKLGVKLATIFQIINLSLSSPQLPPLVLQCSKVYLFLLPYEKQSNRERIVGCAIAQRIFSAMAVVLSELESTELSKGGETTNLVQIDIETNLFCYPTLLPTPMGIPQLFVLPSHRRMGVARALLDAAAATFIHGCPLDPKKGQIAFSQPTGMGQAFMKSWGKGGIRVYEE